MPKFKNLNATFWVIFKQCALSGKRKRRFFGQGTTFLAHPRICSWHCSAKNQKLFQQDQGEGNHSLGLYCQGNFIPAFIQGDKNSYSYCWKIIKKVLFFLLVKLIFSYTVCQSLIFCPKTTISWAAWRMVNFDFCCKIDYFNGTKIRNIWILAPKLVKNCHLLIFF